MNIGTVPAYLVCRGGVQGSSDEWNPLLAPVPLLEGDTHHKEEEGWGGEGQGGEGERWGKGRRERGDGRAGT